MQVRKNGPGPRVDGFQDHLKTRDRGEMAYLAGPFSYAWLRAYARGYAQPYLIRLCESLRIPHDHG